VSKPIFNVLERIIMKRYSIYLYFLLLTVGGGAFGGEEPTLEMLGCDASMCERVAREVDYHHLKPEESFTLKIDHFSFEDP
jgi:hypothetical protein